MERPVSKPDAAPREADCHPLGELVIANGRQIGTRLPLAFPLTLIGRHPCCHLRLNLREVRPLQCLLIPTPEGLLLRSLDAGPNNRVNGQPAQVAMLRTADQLSIGPFHFRIRLPSGGIVLPALPAEDSIESRSQDAMVLHTEAFLAWQKLLTAEEHGLRQQADADRAKAARLGARLRGEQEAVRIQVAAVAAQQTALTEEEIRLDEQRTALQQQERQVAAHLGDQRKRLAELREQVRNAHATLRQERSEHEIQARAQREAIEAARRELAEDQQQVQAQRRRLLDLRRRMKHRWHRHWAAERARIQRQENELAMIRRQLDQERDQLQQQQERLEKVCRHVHTEAELGRRELQAARDQFRQEQEAWEQRRRQEHADLVRRGRALRQLEVSLCEAERLLQDEKRHWATLRSTLMLEAEGLENRVRNQRRKLQTHAIAPGVDGTAAPDDLANLPVAEPLPEASVPEVFAHKSETSLPAAASTEAPNRELLAHLEKLTEDLEDQRLHLREQWERLLTAHEEWERERGSLLEELEQMGRTLHEREEGMHRREQQVGSEECRLDQLRSDVLQSQQRLGSWQARMEARQAVWEAERDRRLADLEAREHLVEHRLSNLDQVQQRWLKRRRQELQLLEADRKTWKRMHQEAQARREEWVHRCLGLERERLGLNAEPPNPLPGSADEGGDSSPGGAPAEAGDGGHRRWEAVAAAAERLVAEQQAILAAEAHQLQERYRQMETQARDLARREAELSCQQTNWERQQASAEMEYASMRQEVLRLDAHRHRYEQQIDELQSDVERLAGLMLAESETAPAPIARAA